MILKTGSLVLVADGGRMLLLRNDGTATVPRLTTLTQEKIENPPAHEQGTDRPGRTQSRTGERRSSYGDTDWHAQTEAQFARHAAELLERAATDDPEAAVIVIASPQTLGKLREHYGRHTTARLVCEIDKDLAGHTNIAIAEAIAATEPT